jgi:hypothetical protein
LSSKNKLKNLLIKKNLDKQYRIKYWMSISGAEREKKLHKDYYYKIIYQYPEYIPSKYDSVIEADLKRTCPNEDYFKKPENKKKLKNVLTAYSRRNSQIGYCQGFNFIVAKLLMIFEKEEDVFWIFVRIIENILPCEYYSELVGVMGDCSLCLDKLKESNKKIMTKLEGFEVVLNNLLYKWFISLFVENTSHETFLTIWDAMMIDGNVVLFKAVSAILELFEAKILATEGIENLTILFEETISKYNFPRDKLIKLLLNEKSIFTPELIENEREKHNKEVIKNIIRTKKNEVRRSQVDINGVEIECDLDYPFCLKGLEDERNGKENQSKDKMTEDEEIKHFQLKNIQLAQTFSSNNPIFFIPNYFQNNTQLQEMPLVEDEEEKLVKSKKLEAIFGFDPYKDKEKEKPKEKTINVNEHLIEAVKVYQNLLIHRDEHVCKTKKQTSKQILASDDREGLSKTITTKSNLTQNYISSYLMGNAQKSFNAGSELELLDKDVKNAPK